MFDIIVGKIMLTMDYCYNQSM